MYLSRHVRELGRAPVQRLLREVRLVRGLAKRAPRAPRELSPWIASWGRFSYGKPDVRGWEGDPHRVHIGRFVSIARDVVILTGGNHRLDWVTTSPLRTLLRLPGAGSDGHPTSDGDVVIEDDIWIGEGAMILSGVRLGRGCTVAARAVVTHDVAPYTIVGGSPARPLRERFDDNCRSQVATVDWCSWPRNVLHRYVAELSSTPSERFLKAADAVAAVRDGKEDGRSFHSAAGLDETYEVTRSEDFTWRRTTVVVACYRHQEHVAAALASVLAQTDRDITIVVTDDASPDSTADRARDVLQTQQRIPWLIARSRANHGLNRILNDILVTTDSPYFAFLGGDDLWEPEKLHVQHDELARHSGA